MSELIPLCVILVENGSKGERLLFRYPYSDAPSSSRQNGVGGAGDGGVYRISVDGDQFCSRPKLTSNIKHHRLTGFPDKLLSNLCTVPVTHCGRRFEVKVSDVRLVGRPTAVNSAPRRGASAPPHKTSAFMFHVVFALWAKADQSVVECYDDLSQRLAIAINHEEKRCHYLTSQARMMIGIQDDYSVSHTEPQHNQSPFDQILSTCQLAREIKTVYDGLASKGTVHVSIGSWIDVSFALPHKVHQLYAGGTFVKPSDIYRRLSLLRPYHALLLLQGDGQRSLLDSLEADCSPALRRIVRMTSPFINLQQLAADADITLTHVMEIVAQLLYWAKAVVIYPLCEKNVYIISPRACTQLVSKLSGDFSESFKGHSLHVALAEFSQPSSVSQVMSPAWTPFLQSNKVEVLVWLLQHALLVQLHTFVFFTPNNQLPVSPVITGDVMSPDVCGGGAGGGVAGTGALLIRICHSDREAVLSDVSAAKHTELLKLFDRLLPYFDGTHHVEEIMYVQNVRRSQVQRVLEQFSHVLTTCQLCDPACCSL